MAARLYCQPRFTYCSPFCAEQVFTKNKPRHVFNKYTSFVFSDVVKTEESIHSTYRADIRGRRRS